jgi:enamine deaminase RidA (YjgF/YER057c/UK114 family)
MKHAYFLALAVFLLPACQQERRGSGDEMESAPGIEKTYVDTHNGYSEAVIINAAGQKTIYISGQIGEGPDLESQMRDALSKMERLLRGAGAGMDDIVKMNTYIVDYGPESLQVFRGVRKELLGDSDMPASTLVGVQSLALSEWLIEIEAVAVVPSR